MKNLAMSLTIDRHLTNGTAAIKGSVGKQRVDLLVERGVEDGNAYVNGQVGSDGVNLTFVRSPYEGYESAVGFYGKTRLAGQLHRRQPDGDTTVSQYGEELLIDRQNQGQRVLLQSAVMDGSFQRDLRDGDELGHMSVGPEGFDYTLDRDERTGGFVLSGRSAGGPFRLEGRRSLSDGDLALTGSVPEGMQMFPVLWEILGDDKNIPDHNPEYPGNVMAMSLFFQNQS
jgi:hypothetical protein